MKSRKDNSWIMGQTFRHFFDERKLQMRKRKKESYEEERAKVERMNNLSTRKA